MKYPKIKCATIQLPCGAGVESTPLDSANSLYKWWLMHRLACAQCRGLDTQKVLEHNAKLMLKAETGS